MNSLKELYIDQMQDIYSACKQSAAVTKKLAEAATNEDLKKALHAGAEGTEKGMQAMSDLVKGHGEDPTDEHCKGMEGLVKEAKAHALEADITDKDVLDASIITQYQRMVHYAIAGYGCIAAFAKRLDLEDDAKRIQECLDQTYDGDRTMTDLATGGINAAAA